MNVFITGAGLVGCNLARILNQRGHEVVLWDVYPRKEYIRSVAGDVPVEQGDMQDLAALIETMHRYKVETVVHTAFLIGQRIAERPYSGVRANVDGTLAAVEAAHLTGAKRFLFASTQGIYNLRLATEPISEDAPYSEADRFYPACKVACERLLRAFNQAYELEIVLLRFAQIYGRGHYAGGDGLGPVMHTMLAAAAAGRPVSIDPGRVQRNDLVYAKDVADGVALACEKPLKHTSYNIGSGRIVAAADIMNAIRKVLPEVPVQLLPGLVTGDAPSREYPLDITRAQVDLGYDPHYDIEKGVAAFINELRDHG